ncbi:MAG: ketopantoate reductase C-terminal domain-containing protein, partial [Bauldia sp.]
KSGGPITGDMNGPEVYAVVDVMGEERGLDAVIEITSAMYEPGLVERHSGFDLSWFAVGAPKPAARKHVPLAAALLRHAGTVEEVDDIRSAKWMTLVADAGELVPSAILDLSIVDCALINSMRPIMIRAGDEAIRFAKEEGLTIRPIFGMEGAAAANPDTFMQTILDELVAHYVKPHSRSTFLQDWIKGRHCEVEEINGSVVEGLSRHGVAAPVNRTLVEFARDIERGLRQRGRHNVEPLLARIEELDAEAPPAIATA